MFGGKAVHSGFDGMFALFLCFSVVLLIGSKEEN